MSKIALSGNPNGTGTFTIASPNSNTDRTLTLPNATGTVALTSQIPAASTIASTAEAQAGTNNTNFITPLRMRQGFNASGSAPVYACRAFVNCNGSGTVRAAGNVSSVAKGGTGIYTLNFATAMPDANYSVGLAGISFSSGNTTSTISILNSSGANYTGPAAVKSTTQLRICSGNPASGGFFDFDEVNVQIFR